MRKNIYFLLFFAIAIGVKAQVTEVQPLNFNYKTSTGLQRTNVPFDTNDFKQNEFILGTQWGGDINVIRALKMNFIQNWYPVINFGDYVQGNPFTNYKVHYCWDFGNDFLDAHSLSFVYEPTLFIPENQRENLVINPNDKSRPIWGFSHIDGTILAPKSDSINYSLELYKDSLANYSADSLVLRHIWPNKDKFILLGSNVTRNGEQWLLRVNLRRLDSTESASNNDTILRIRIPYHAHITDDSSHSDYIKFKQLPQNSLDNAIHLNYRGDRGWKIPRDTLPGNQYTKEFVITNRMLPDVKFIKSNLPINVTISAYFVCKDSLPQDSTKYYKPYYNPYAKHANYYGIDTMDIEVKYCGKHNIAVNFIQLTTVGSEPYWEGIDDINAKNIMQNDIKSIEDSNYVIYGLYGRDEMPEAFFSSERYTSNLMNKVLVAEGAGGDHPYHYNYNVEPQRLWFGSHTFQNRVAAPYLKYNRDEIQKRDDIKGFTNNVDVFRMAYPDYGYDHYNCDTMNSGYETGLKNDQSKTNANKSTWLAVRDSKIDNYYYQFDTWTSRGFNFYYDLLNQSNSTLGYNECKIYDQYYKYYKDIYRDKFWWSNMLPGGFWSTALKYYWNSPKDSVIKMLASICYDRPQTGEEVRLNIWQPLIFGAKGLTYDARCDIPMKLTQSGTYNSGPVGGMPTWFTNKYINSPDSLIFSNDPAAGLDYIPEIDSAINITSVMLKDSSAKYLGVTKDNIYYGRRSIKTEMYKAHTWIRAVEPQLMRLRLAAAYSKGFRIWRNYDSTRYTSDPLDKWLKLDNRLVICSEQNPNQTLVSSIGIRTKPLTRDQYETWDSSFVDVTLLADTNDRQMENSCFIGVCNRRTDPLYVAWDKDYKDHGRTGPCFMDFRPSAEMDDLVQGKDRWWWKRVWWSKLGCREIHIKFNFDAPRSISLDYYHLKITELGADNKEYQKNWWRSPELCQTVDTLIATNGELILRLTPGEGKICKVELVHSDTLTGHLEKSNQCKIVAYPCSDNEKLNNSEITSVRYHMTYAKHDPTTGRMAIYYRRSEPVASSITIPTTAIPWEANEICLSDTLITLQRYWQNWDTVSKYDYNAHITFNYPSIVVRQENGQAEAFIVAQCLQGPKMSICDTCGHHPSIISESIITNINGDKPQLLRPTREIMFVNGDSCNPTDRWGIPVINASATGNYISWADSLKGICAGFKEPNAQGFAPYYQTCFTYYPCGYKQLPNVTDPSVNTYSKLRYNETDCALVWAEALSGKDINEAANIFYTQLYTDGSGIHYRTAKTEGYSIKLFYNSDSTIVMVNQRDPKKLNINSENRYPTVYRGIGESFRIFNGYPPLSSHRDVIEWQCRDIAGNYYWNRPVVMYTLFQFNDSCVNGRFVPYIYYSWDIIEFMSLTYDILHPNISQGRLSIDSLGNAFEGDSSVITNFEVSGTIWHVPHHYSTIFSDWQSTMNFPTYKYAREAEYGLYPQLAKIPYISSGNEYCFNRRVYNYSAGELDPTIISSVQHFYAKGISSGPEMYPFFGFRKDTSIYTLQNLPVMTDNNGSVIPIKFITDSISQLHNSDTLYTNWFRLGNLTEVKSLAYRKNLNKAQFLLQRSDGRIFEYSLDSSNYQEIFKQKTLFINGSNLEYRLLWVKPRDAQYFEAGIIGTFNDDYDESSPHYKANGASSQTELIDLGEHSNTGGNSSLNVYPDPASDKVIIHFTGQSVNSSCKLKVFNLLGTELYSGSVKEINELNVSSYPTGVYSVVIETETGSIKTNFVVSR